MLHFKHMKKLILLSLFAFLFSINFTHAQKPQAPADSTQTVRPRSCSAPRLMNDAEVTPTGIAAFANQHNLSVSDVVCCLPESWRNQYVVASTSQSLQHSTPNNPRIILGPPTNFNGPADGRAVTFYLDGSGTIETHDQAQSSPPSATVPFADSRFSVVTFSEAEIRENTGNPNATRRAHANLSSERCASCHGTPASPLFSFAPTWPNTFPKIYKSTVCPTPSENRAFETERAQIMAAVRRPNSLAACLPGFERTIQTTGLEPLDQFYERAIDCPPRNRGPRGSFIPMEQEKIENIAANRNDFSMNRLGLMTEGFEMNMIEISHQRAANQIRQWSGYERNKYALVGAMLGCIAPESPDMASWFPRTELSRQTTVFNGDARNPLTRHEILRNVPSAEALTANLTCQTPQQMGDFQDLCFPANCQTTPRMVRNIRETLSLARTQEERSTPDSQANAAVLRSIATANYDLKRNWLPLGCGNRNGDADSWGVVRYLSQVMSPSFDISSAWSQLFTDSNNQRLIDTMGRQIIRRDPELQRIVGDTRTSPCERLARASMNAYNTMPAPAAPTAPSSPVQSRPAGVTR